MNDLTLEEAAEVVKNAKTNQTKLANHFSIHFKLNNIYDFINFCFMCGFRVELDRSKLTDKEIKFFESIENK